MIRTVSAAFVLLVLSASAAAGPPPVPREERALAIVERLYLNHHALREAYQEIRAIAGYFQTAPDRKLNNIQRIYIFVEAADETCLSQWELLALMPAIRDDRRSDYFTYRVRGLRRAVDRTRVHLNLIRLYRAFLENETAVAAVDAAVALIEGNVYMYEQLAGIIEPLGNPRRAW